jgi:hypothetical protein
MARFALLVVILCVVAACANNARYQSHQLKLEMMQLSEEQRRVGAQQLVEYKALFERAARLQVSLRNTQEDLVRRQTERDEVVRELQWERENLSKRTQPGRSEARPDSKRQEAKGPDISRLERDRRLKRLLYELRQLLDED